MMIEFENQFIIHLVDVPDINIPAKQPLVPKRNIKMSEKFRRKDQSNEIEKEDDISTE